MSEKSVSQMNSTGTEVAEGFGVRVGVGEGTGTSATTGLGTGVSLGVDGL